MNPGPGEERTRSFVILPNSIVRMTTNICGYCLPLDQIRSTMNIWNTLKKEKAKMPKKVPKLYSHNVDVDRVNHEELIKLQTEKKQFSMEGEGRPALVAALKKGCLSPEDLLLSVGASIMFTKNNPKEGYVNGTLGEVLRFEQSSGLPVVKTKENRYITVSPMEWSIEENGKVRASIRQLPLRLAWAITVHKSQGMSMDEAIMDLSQVFEYGQGYVALSRVRRLSGLYILGWNRRAFEVHPRILEEDVRFKNASEETADAFSRSEEHTSELQ